jgi:hypothetical protein
MQYAAILNDPDLPPISEYASASVRPRIMVERAIARAVVDAALASDYGENGGDADDYVGNDRKKILGAMFATDDEKLNIYRGEYAGKVYAGFVHFVYGNDGWDVISNYSLKLEGILKPAIDLSNQFGG